MCKYLSALVILFLFFLAAVPAKAVNYTVTDLGTLGGTNSYASDINAGGLVVGDSLLADGSQHAFVYRDGSMHDLGTLGGTNSMATAINASGDVVGWSDMTDGSQHAFIYRDSAMHDLGTLGGTSSWAYDINDKGQIVGAAYTADGSQRAFLYSGGIMQNIDTFVRADSAAYGINNNGRIVGEYTTFIGHDITDKYSIRAYSIGDGVMEDLGIPSISQASKIDDSGTILGMQDTNGFIYRDGSLQVSNYVWSGINASGQIVGTPMTLFGPATLFSNGTLMNLNNLIGLGFEGLLDSAAGINDDGKIVGSALYGDFLNQNGTTRAYLLTPIPEPSMLILLAGVLASFTGMNLARTIVKHCD
jgi:probable HAF family extracellular repeat protein